MELFSDRTKGLQAATTLATAYKYFHTHNSGFFSNSGRKEVDGAVHRPLSPRCCVTKSITAFPTLHSNLL